MTITDSEFSDAGGRIEHRYEAYLPGRVERTVKTDPLSYRWMVDYYTLRSAGRDHEAAIREVERRIHAVAGLPDPWPPPPAPPRPLPSLVGQLRVTGAGFMDDTGPVMPVFKHAGAMFSQYAHGQEAFVTQQLDVVAGAGFHGVRSWTVLDFPIWHDKGLAIGPGRAGFWGHVEGFARLLKSKGLTWVCSQGDVRGISDRRGFMRTLAGVANTVGPSVFAVVDGGNEAWQTGEADPAKLAQMATWFREVCPSVLLTLTSPPGEDVAELNAFSIDPADLYDVHSYRGGNWVDKTRHSRIAYDGPRRRQGISSEPPAIGASVMVNPHEMDDEAQGLLAAQVLIHRQAYVLMSGPGVWGDGPLESVAGFTSVPLVAAALMATAKDVMSYPHVIHGGARFRGQRVLVAEQGEFRCDQIIADDGRFVATVFGPHPPYRVPVERSFQGTVIHPTTGAQEPLTAQAGSTFQMAFTRGRIIAGRTT